MEKTIVYFAIPKPWIIERETKKDRSDAYDEVTLSLYDSELRTFSCPNYKKSDLMYIPLPLDESDIEWLNGKSIKINAKVFNTIQFMIDWQIWQIKNGFAQHIDWLRIIWEDGRTEQINFSQNIEEPVRLDGTSLSDIALLCDSANHVQLCIHDAYFNSRNQSAKIEFSMDKNIPMFEEIIFEDHDAFSVRTVIQGNFLKKDAFVYVRNQIEEGREKQTIHSGSYAIKPRDIIVKFYIYSDNDVYLNFFKVYRIDREKAKVHASLVLSYKDGVWDNPNPPERAKNWLSFFIKNKDRILKRGKLF